MQTELFLFFICLLLLTEYEYMINAFVDLIHNGGQGGTEKAFLIVNGRKQKHVFVNKISLTTNEGQGNILRSIRNLR